MATYTGSDKRLQYLFQNGGGGGGSSTLAGLSDVDLTSPTDGQVLKYDANNDEWINANESGGGGGTNVEANPQGTPTDWLNSLKVGNLIYSVAKVGDCYSTTERQVGCFTDGKPLYQKSWLLTIPNSSGMYQFTDVAIPNLEKVIDYDFIILPNGEGGYTPWYNNATVLFSTQSATYAQFFFASGAYAGSTLLYTCKYTKTTDTAGAGIWTPSGAYAEHYTTAERIIGTWDGKPLYRRILPQISMNSGGYSYTHNIGVKYYINFGGHCTVNGTPSQNLPFPFYQNRWNGYCAIQSTYNNSIVFDATWNNNTVDCYIDYTKEADYI